MSADSQRPLPPMEVKGSHRLPERAVGAVKKVHLAAPDANLLSAKAEMGAVIRDAIGPDKLEAYGHAGLVSGVCSGEKVPDYLASIFQNEAARLRMAKALLRKSGKQVRERTVFEIEEKVG